MTHDAEGRVRAFLDARDRFAASARQQGVEGQHPALTDNIAHQPDTAAVVHLPGWLEVAWRPGSASFPLNAEDLRAVLQALADTRNLIATFKACNWPQTWAQTRNERDQALAERDRFRTELADMRQQLDEAQHRIAKLEGKARAIRSHFRVRMDILRDRQHEAPRRKEIIAKIEQLTDLTACLDHLYDEPEPTVGPTRHGHDTTTSGQD